MTNNLNTKLAPETAGTPRQAIAAADPLRIEKNLRSWASSRILSRGREYYRQGRVLTLDAQAEGVVCAAVEGTLEAPYQVDIRFDRFGLPMAKCSCPYKWEPLCKHAVAVLIAWQQEETGSEPRLGALPDAGEACEEPAARERHLQELAAIEIAERRARCGEQGLRVLRTPAPGPLGAYQVASGNPALKDRAYRVVVRDEGWRHASCGCVDFLANELGTCKHVEAVRRYLGKEGAKRLLSAAQRSRRVSAYLAPRPSHLRHFELCEEIRVHVPPGAAGSLPSWFARRLDADGYLRDVRSENAALDLARLLKRLTAKTGLSAEADPALWRALRDEDEARRWERSIDALDEKSAAWRASIGRLNVSLHPYQREGIQFAVKKRRAFIGDDMGLGKTVQAVGAALLLKELGQVKRVLVVCPASLKHQWQAEIERLSRAKAAIIAGSARERAEQYRQARDFFILVNYELLYRDLDAIAALAPDLIVLDEAQRIKNWDTKIAQTLKRLDSPFKLVLTGTPLENRLAELQSIAEFLDPRALGAPWKLVPAYANLDAEGKIVGYARLDHLRERLGKFLIRRTRPEVLSQLPKRTDNNFWTKITAEQQQVHDELGGHVMRLMQKLKKFKRLTREDLQRLFMLLNSMRIACNAYGQYDWKPLELEVLTARRASPGLLKKIGSPKLEEFRRVMSDLLEQPGQKIVVFSQWERMIRLAELCVRDLLEDSGARSVIYSGRLSLKKRAAEVRRFLGDPGTRVFFSTDAGGVGLNLQSAANCVVNLEIPWNPAVLEQRVGRVHRMGQKKSVQVVNLISSECVEERIFNLVAQKKALFSGIFDPAAKDIRFDATQKASFLDKMKLIVPEDAAAIAGAPDQQRQAAAADDSVAEVKAPAQAAQSPALEVDLAPLAGALASLLPAAAGGISAAGASLKLHVSQDEAGVHLDLPRPALELLRGFRPVLEALLKIGPRQ